MTTLLLERQVITQSEIDAELQDRGDESADDATPRFQVSDFQHVRYLLMGPHPCYSALMQMAAFTRHQNMSYLRNHPYTHR